MTVQELIDALNELPDKSLLVAVEADHGQTPQRCSGIGEARVENLDSYFLETVFTD